MSEFNSEKFKAWCDENLPPEEDEEAPPETENEFSIRIPEEVLAMKFDESDRILGDRLLAKGQSLVVAGPGGVGKSRLVLQLAACSLIGADFVGLATQGQGLRWLFLQTENSNRRLQSDLKGLKAWIGQADWPAVNAGMWIHTLENDLDGFVLLSNQDVQSRLTEVIQRYKPHVIVFDPLYDFRTGDLNKDEEMLMTLGIMSHLARTGDSSRALIVIHHALTGKAGAAKATGFDRSSFGRNSKALHSWTRGQINVAPGDPYSNDVLVISCGKCSNGKEFPGFAIELDLGSMIYKPKPDFDFEAWESDVKGSSKSSGSRIPLELIAELARGGKFKEELVEILMKTTECKKSYAYKRINEAEAAKKIHQDKLNKRFYPA